MLSSAYAILRPKVPQLPPDSDLSVWAAKNSSIQIRDNSTSTLEDCLKYYELEGSVALVINFQPVTWPGRGEGVAASTLRLLAGNLTI